MQGAVNYSPVTNVPYDIFGFVKGAMNRHARDSLSKGYSPQFSVDPDNGYITSVTGKGGPGVSIPGIGSLMSMIGANMGAVTTTGYAGKGVDDQDIGGNESDSLMDQYRPQIRPINPPVPVPPPVRRLTSAELFNQNPDRYTLNVSGINSLRNR